MMESEAVVSLQFSPKEGRITVERTQGPLISRKEITQEQFLTCFRKSVHINEASKVYATGLLPFNTLAVKQTEAQTSLLLWHPHLYADVSLYKTPYPHFPIPRLIFGFSVEAETGLVSNCRIGVVENEVPTPDTIMYRYPFSNVNPRGSLCIGNNELPKYRELRKSGGLPAFLLSIPNNFDSYCVEANQLGLDYRDLMEHLKDKEPAYYYTDILVPNGETLAQFIKRM